MTIDRATIAQAIAELDTTTAALNEIRELHQRGIHFPYCMDCLHPWPCPTTQTLRRIP